MNGEELGIGYIVYRKEKEYKYYGQGFCSKNRSSEESRCSANIAENNWQSFYHSKETYY